MEDVSANGYPTKEIERKRRYRIKASTKSTNVADVSTSRPSFTTAPCDATSFIQKQVAGATENMDVKKRLISKRKKDMENICSPPLLDIEEKMQAVALDPVKAVTAPEKTRNVHNTKRNNKDDDGISAIRVHFEDETKAMMSPPGAVGPAGHQLKGHKNIHRKSLESNSPLEAIVVPSMSHESPTALPQPVPTTMSHKTTLSPTRQSLLHYKSSAAGAKEPRRKTKTKRGDEKHETNNEPFVFEEHLSLADARKGIQEGRYVQGILRINKRNRYDGYVTLKDLFEKDVCVKGVANQNRAVDGDTVVLSIFPETEWRRTTTTTTTSAIAAHNPSPDATVCDVKQDVFLHRMHDKVEHEEDNDQDVALRPPSALWNALVIYPHTCRATCDAMIDVRGRSPTTIILTHDQHSL
jgi:hypothetical protein